MTFQAHVVQYISIFEQQSKELSYPPTPTCNKTYYQYDYFSIQKLQGYELNRLSSVIDIRSLMGTCIDGIAIKLVWPTNTEEFKDNCETYRIDKEHSLQNISKLQDWKVDSYKIYPIETKFSNSTRSFLANKKTKKNL